MSVSEWEVRYHVPRSQVWAGSRGGQLGAAHLHVGVPNRVCLTAVKGRRTVITRGQAAVLCGRNGWYERPLATGEEPPRCAECLRLAERYGVEWPAVENPRRRTAPSQYESGEG